ncbi:MAG TPA: hypothetical protein VFG95_05580 [Nitrospiria bacterium]|nr:hypothetical protein [Nitrospiria bacterium]
MSRRRSLVYLPAIFIFMACSLIGLLPQRSALGDASGREGTVEFWIRTNKPVYEQGEAIYITMTLKNGTDDPLSVNRRWRMLQEIDFELFKDPGGFQPFRPSDDKSPFKKEDFILVRPGGEVRKTVDINKLLVTPLTSGIYGIRGSYKNEETGKALGIEGWLGDIVSNRVNFQIKPSRPM